MKTKTLLIAAATLAAGIISTQAQSNVYSANIVGYINVSVPSNSFVLVGNQLNLDNTNNINNLFSGLVSDSGGQNNTVIWLFNPTTSQYNSYQYFTGPDADSNFFTSGSVAGFYDYGGTLQNIQLGVGQAAFLQNITTSSTVTFVGTVQTGTNVINIQPGYNLISVPVPLSGDLVTNANINFVGTSDPSGANNDTIWVWNPVSQQYNSYQYFTGADADSNFFVSGSVNGFYDYGGNLQSITPSAGSGFFIQHLDSGTNHWTSVFNP